MDFLTLMIDDFDDYDVSIDKILDKKKCTLLVSDVGEGYLCVETWGIWKISIAFSQFNLNLFLKNCLKI